MKSLAAALLACLALAGCHHGDDDDRIERHSAARDRWHDDNSQAIRHDDESEDRRERAYHDPDWPR
jgi:hypothetical protein